MATIEVSDLGPVHRLTIPIPETGGVVVFRGRHGVGKSRTLAAVDAMASGRGGAKLQARDGSSRGEIEGLGARIVVSRKTSRTGQLEVTTLEGKLSIADLVDPGLIDENAADAKRIKALCLLAGVAAEIDLFRTLMPDATEFDAVVAPETIKTDDILQMAAAVKRQFEKAALGAEGQANQAKAHANACEEAARDVDLAAEHNGDTLQVALEEAIREQQRLQSERSAGLRHNAGIEAARAKLAEASAAGAGAEVVAARERANATGSAWQRDVKRVTELKMQLSAAEADLATSRRDADAAADALAAAERNAEALAEAEKTVAAAGAELTIPTQDDIDDASVSVLSARKAVERGAAIRQAMKKLEDRKRHHADMHAAERRAEVFRNAAASVDSVLTDQIAKLGCALRVEKGRLVTETDRGPSELYAELSHGEREKIALQIAVDSVGAGGLLTVSQEAWAALNGSSKAWAANYAKEKAVVILTAEVTEDDELTAAEFVPPSAAELMGE